MEVANQFAIGVNRGNPDSYKESRFELVDHLTKNVGKHTLSFGGDYNWVRTTESFPLFYPFEAIFLCVAPDASNPLCGMSNLMEHDPVLIEFERFQAPSFTEPTFDPAVFQLSHYPDVEHRWVDRKSTRLNSSHVAISYAVFCLKKKTTHIIPHTSVIDT